MTVPLTTTPAATAPAATPVADERVRSVGAWRRLLGRPESGALSGTVPDNAPDSGRPSRRRHAPTERTRSRPTAPACSAPKES
jgi:hypothetical protein